MYFNMFDEIEKSKEHFLALFKHYTTDYLANREISVQLEIIEFAVKSALTEFKTVKHHTDHPGYCRWMRSQRVLDFLDLMNTAEIA